MIIAIPPVKPTVTGNGINLMIPPSFAMPKMMSITPAIKVAVARPS